MARETVLLGRRRGRQFRLARAVVPADLFHREILFAGAVLLTSYLVPVNLDHVANLHVRGHAGQSVNLLTVLLVHFETVRAGSDATLDGVMRLMDFDQNHGAHYNNGQDAHRGAYNFTGSRPDVPR